MDITDKKETQKLIAECIFGQQARCHFLQQQWQNMQTPPDANGYYHENNRFDGLLDVIAEYERELNYMLMDAVRGKVISLAKYDLNPEEDERQYNFAFLIDNYAFPACLDLRGELAWFMEMQGDYMDEEMFWEDLSLLSECPDPIPPAKILSPKDTVKGILALREALMQDVYSNIIGFDINGLRDEEDDNSANMEE